MDRGGQRTGPLHGPGSLARWARPPLSRWGGARLASAAEELGALGCQGQGG